MNIRNVKPDQRKAIVKGLESLIKKHKVDAVKTVVTNYFKNYSERRKAAGKIAELQKEIASAEFDQMIDKPRLK